MRNDCAIGSGSLAHEASITIASIFFPLSRSFSIASIQSFRTTQHMHPFDTSMSSSVDFSMRSESILVSPNSFSTTAILSPWFPVMIWLRRVVLPLPRNQVMIVIGIILCIALFTKCYQLNGLRFECERWKCRMIFFYGVTIHAAFELHCFFFFGSALAEGKIFFSLKIYSMEESFIVKFFENPIESCLIHFSRIHKKWLEWFLRFSFFLFKEWEDMTTMDSWEHRWVIV